MVEDPHLESFVDFTGFANFQLIFSEECTEAEGRTWHMTHFSCSNCDVQLGGQRYIAKNDKILCIPCYYRNFSLFCNTCRKEIAVEKPHITQSTVHWHADERCFCCDNCGKNLLGKRYSFRDNRLYCASDTGCRKRHPKVTFDTKVVAVSSRRRGSVPEPPPRNPPSPPAENIYETVLPCSSKDSEEFEPPRGNCRRSRSADVQRSCCDELCQDGYCKRNCHFGSKKQNYYSKMPPPSPSQRRKHQQCSSCSSSESDSDDVYLSSYLAASLSNFDKHTVQNSENCTSILNRVRTRKNKSSNNCIVS